MLAKDIAQGIIRGNYSNLDKYSTFHQESFIYKKTNEKLYEFFDLLLNKDKILSVIGSGDQILNSMLTNPSKIDAFDISVFPRYFLELKIGAVKGLSREEYLQFFFDTTMTTLDEYYDDLYFEKISPNLDEEVKNFWDYLFEFNDWYDIYHSSLFSSENINDDYALKQNKYLGVDEYYQLRKNLSTVKINYIESDLLNLNIQDSYDLIYLSNIVNYVAKNDYLKKIEEFSEKSKGIIVTYIFGELKEAITLFHEHSSSREFEGDSGVIITKSKVKK